MKRHLRFLLSVAAVSALFPYPASALCQLPQPRLVCGEYFSSQIIVNATLLRTEGDESAEDKQKYPNLPAPAFIFHLHVNQVLRGKSAQTIQVYEGNDSGRAAFEWLPGTKYLLFLFPSQERKGMWSLDGCGNSGPLNERAAALTEIENVKAGSKTGLIEGVTLRPSVGDVPGIHIEAKGGAGRFTAITNGQGEFRIVVPLGRYKVSVVEPDRRFPSYDIVYDDPDHVQIVSGGCAQVAFMEETSPPGSP